MCNGRRAEAERNRFRSTETNIAFGPPKPISHSVQKPKAVVELAFFSQSLFLIAFLVLGGGREGRPFVVCEGQAQTHRHKNRQWFQFVYVWCWEVVIENLVFLNGKFNTCWKVWVLMLAAGSEVVIENLVFLNGKFNTCWKVWVLMLAAGSEVLMKNYLPAELWSTTLSPTSGVERRFMTLQVCQFSMDDVTELGETVLMSVSSQAKASVVRWGILASEENFLCWKWRIQKKKKRSTLTWSAIQNLLKTQEIPSIRNKCPCRLSFKY